MGCEGKAEFSSAIYTPVFGITYSFRNYSNMIWCSRKKISSNIMGFFFFWGNCIQYRILYI